MRKEFIIAGAILLLAGYAMGVHAGNNGVFHALHDVTSDDAGTISVDNDGDGVIDNAEMACGIGINCLIDGGDIQDGAVTTTELLNNTIKAIDVDNSQLQLRITGTCGVGMAIKQINANGTVICETSQTPTFAMQTGTDTTAQILGGGSSYRYVATSACPPSTPKVVSCDSGWANTSGILPAIYLLETTTTASECTLTMQNNIPNNFVLTAYAYCSS